jgi:hypothetical protein
LMKGERRDNVGKYYQKRFHWETSIEAVQCFTAA